MMKRITAIILALMLVFSLASCSKAKNTEGDGVILPTPKDGKAELTILISSIDYKGLSGNFWFSKYIEKFKQDFGVDIKFEQIETNTGGMTPEEYDEYLKKVFVKLTAKDGLELVFSHYMNLQALIDQQAVIDLRGKVSNLDKVYDSLLSDKVYYAPLGIDYIGALVNIKALDELGLKAPMMNWTLKDYYNARNKWTLSHKTTFNGYEYLKVFDQFINTESLYKAEENKVVLNSPEVRQKINDLRSYIFGGTYQLPTGYTYENYYNMLYEYNSKERKDSNKIAGNILAKGHLDGGGIDNLFRAKNLQERIKGYAVIREPRNMSSDELLDSYGFLVNKNGKHLDLAYEFINGLLSDENQMAMFQYEDMNYPHYPVNKDIEADILKLEAEAGLDPRAIQVKSIVLQDLKAGKCRLWTNANINIYRLFDMIDKDLTKFILADEPYSDELLQAELKKLEDKYNIYLNE